MGRLRLPLAAGAVRKLLQEIESSGEGEHVLAVGGAPELASELRQQLLRGRGEPGAVRLGDPRGAHVYVHVLASALSDADVAVLRQVRRRRLPVVAVAVGFPREVTIPYVLATDLVEVEAGRPFPLERIARAIAAALGEAGAPLAARLPLLREPVCDQLVSSFARKNGVAAAAVWIPGADLPILALNELRLVLRLAQAHGVESTRELMPELAGTLGAAFGLRALARELLDMLPVAGWALKGTFAYAGTRALGEAARARFSHGSTPPRASAERAEL